MMRAAAGVLGRGAALALLLAWSAPAAAQVVVVRDTVRDRSVRSDVENILEDGWRVVTGPTRASSEDWATAGIIAGGFGALLLVDGAVYRWVQDNPESVVLKVIGPFREGSPLEALGWTKFLTPAAALAYASGLAFDNDDLRDAGLGCVTANLTTTVPRLAFSYIFGRLRPRSGADPYVFELFTAPEWEMRSLPGGHASNAMSCASFLNHRFDMGVAEPVVYTLAGGIGVARVVDGAHWPSDTFLGMSYGFGVGRALAGLSADRAAGREPGTVGLVVGARIRF